MSDIGETTLAGLVALAQGDPEREERYRQLYRYATGDDPATKDDPVMQAISAVQVSTVFLAHRLSTVENLLGLMWQGTEYGEVPEGTLTFWSAIGDAVDQHRQEMSGASLIDELRRRADAQRAKGDE